MKSMIRRALATSALAFYLVTTTAIGAQADEAGFVEIYESGAYTLAAPPPEMKPLVLQVPEAFRYGSSKGATRAWGLNILTYYPSFTSPKEPANKAFGLNCAGDCNGRILIAINLRTHSINNPEWLDAPNMGDAIAKIDLQKRVIPKGSVVTDLGPEYGFDRGYEVHTPPENGLSEQIKKYLFHLGTDGIHFDRTADCSVNQFARTCTLHFSLKCDPAIYVQVVAIDMRHIDDFSEVVSKTDQFVTSMVRAPACI